jgi:hypothetical protein
MIDMNMTLLQCVFCHERVKNLSTKTLFAAGAPPRTEGVLKRKTIVSIGFFRCFEIVNKSAGK